MRVVRLMVIGGLLCGFAGNSWGKEPNWTGPVVKRGEDRVETQQTPIESRPYRPLHFYGNTIRRVHYRGQVLPRPRDVLAGTSAFVTQR